MIKDCNVSIQFITVASLAAAGSNYVNIMSFNQIVSSLWHEML